MFRTVYRFTALSFGTTRPQFMHLTKPSCPRFFLERPLLRRFLGILMEGRGSQVLGQDQTQLLPKTHGLSGHFHPCQPTSTIHAYI